MIVLPASHRHASDRSLPLAALASDTMILFPRAIAPVLHDAIIASCHRAGLSPKLDQEASQTVSIVYMVAAGFGVSIYPQSLEQLRVEGVAYLPRQKARRPARWSVSPIAEAITRRSYATSWR